MRILHLSDHEIPDWRIEKTAKSSSKLGHEVISGGTNGGKINYNTKTFSKVYEINFHWNLIKKQMASSMGTETSSNNFTHRLSKEIVSSATTERAAEEIRTTNDTANSSKSKVKDLERLRFNAKLSSVFDQYGSKKILATWYTRRLDGLHELFENQDR